MNNTTDNDENPYSSLQMQCAHGLMMITAWMFTASVGLIAARFYKPAWPGRQVFKAQLWFTIHRVCMVMTLLLDVAAFILIFIEAQSYVGTTEPRGYQAAHPAIGIVITALIIVNPVLALFRCDPDHPKRPLFTWTHTYVGYIAHILALINIFFGFGLYIDQNPLFPVTPVAWIMFAYVMFHIFSEAVLQTHSQLRVWQQQQRIKQCGLQIREHAVITKDISHNYDLGQVSSIKAMDSCASDGTFGNIIPYSMIATEKSFSNWTSTGALAANNQSNVDYLFLHGYLCVYTSVVTGLWIAMVVIMSLNI